LMRPALFATPPLFRLFRRFFRQTITHKNIHFLSRIYIPRRSTSLPEGRRR
jgi:hypothetical protein